MKLKGPGYLTSRFFLAGGSCAALFFISYGIPFLLVPAIVLLCLFVLISIYDVFNIYRIENPVTGSRITNPVWSLGSDAAINYRLVNKSDMFFFITMVEELPDQFQERDNKIRFRLESGKEWKSTIRLHPVQRGRYHFGFVQVFISSPIRLIERRISVVQPIDIQVYPSIEQMKKLQIANFSKASLVTGVKKVRRLGNTQEFEQIKAYAIGDDQKRINWKSTGKRAEIMVNQYQDERSQQVYCIIDKSRVMDFVSNGLSLLDHSINAALVLSNIAIGKQDKAGLITYSSKPESFVKADRRAGQLKVILEKLYREKESHSESNLELLYYTITKNITQRSLLVFFTNFESGFSLERAMPILRRLNKSHVVMVIFFENEEIRDFSRKGPESVEDVYEQVIAEKYLYEKRQMQIRLRNYGIFAIVTKPDQLAVNAINKYLELKSRGII